MPGWGDKHHVVRLLRLRFLPAFNDVLLQVLDKDSSNWCLEFIDVRPTAEDLRDNYIATTYLLTSVLWQLLNVSFYRAYSANNLSIITCDFPNDYIVDMTLQAAITLCRTAFKQITIITAKNVLHYSVIFYQTRHLASCRANPVICISEVGSIGYTWKWHSGISPIPS